MVGLATGEFVDAAECGAAVDSADAGDFDDGACVVVVVVVVALEGDDAGVEVDGADGALDTVDSGVKGEGVREALRRAASFASQRA